MTNITYLFIGLCVGFIIGVVILSIIYARKFKKIRDVIHNQVIKKGEDVE